MHLFQYILLRVYVCVCTCVCVSPTCVCMCMYVCVCVCMCLCACGRERARAMRVNVHVCEYVWMNTCDYFIGSTKIIDTHTFFFWCTMQPTTSTGCYFKRLRVCVYIYT